MSTFGNTVSVFNNFLALTRETRLTPANDIINDACRQTYLLGEAMRGREVGEIIRGGKYISDRIKLVNTSNFRFYTPGEERNPSRTSTIQTINVPWRFAENDYPYTDAELELNEGDEFAKFKSFEKVMMMDLKTDHWEGMEDSMFALPNQGNMEAGVLASGAVSPGQSYSIPTFITEKNQTTVGGSAAAIPPANNGTFTTIEGIDPSTYANWENAVEVYDPANLDDPTAGIFAAFDAMMLDIDFKRPAGFKEYMENDDLRKLKICTNKDGVNKYQQLCREGNDHFRAGPQDPSYGDAQFKGIPVRYIKTLDTALLEQNPIGTYTAAVYPNGRPRYFFINLKYLFPVFHGKHFMDETDPVPGGSRQRDATTMYIVSWFNLLCRSRRRQGIIRPNA